MNVRNRGPQLFDVERMVEEYRGILARCELTIGPWNHTLEDEFAATAGVRYAVTCSSGGDALMMILIALKHMYHARRVLISANSHVATASSAILLGFEVELMDVDDDLLLDLTGVIERVERNEVVIVTAIGGWLPERLSEVIDVIQKKGAFVVLDAAHAHGVSYAGRPIGAWGLAASFSFYGSKLVCGGEGGIVATDCRELARELRRVRDCGKVSPEFDAYPSVGLSSRLSNVLAMMAAVQARHLPQIIEQRRGIATRYIQAVGQRARVVNVPHHDQPNWYKYILVMPSAGEASELEQYLLSNGIELSSKVFPQPLHQHPAMSAQLGALRFPRAEALCSAHVCLPGYVGITRDEIEYVCDRLAHFWDLQERVRRT